MTHESIASIFADPMLYQIPRLLTQVDRNLHSPTYGCCCRNHWHYRTQDSPNSRMQEMVLTFALAWKLELPDNPYYRSPRLLDWIEAILAYTVRTQRRRGCFDENYRGQDAYAATAFVAFHVSETVLQLGRNLPGSLRKDLDSMLYRAALWLERTGEQSAGSEVAGAAAAFMNLIALDPGRGYEAGFDDLLKRLQAMQSDEGWFPEYGGADIGYGSLTHSFLALIAHRDNDQRVHHMSHQSAAFLQRFLHRDGTVGGEYGSRNTACFIPLGAVLNANTDDASARIFHHLLTYTGLGEHAHITDGLDDRYLAYWSPFYLLAAQATSILSPGALVTPTPRTESRHLVEAGLWSVENDALKLLVNLHKGGVFHLDLNRLAYTDNGYFGDIPDGQVVTTQHLESDTTVSVTGNRARLSARLLVNRPRTISPWKNIAMRIFNLTVPSFPRRLLLDFLRERVMRTDESVGQIHREIVVAENSVEVTDHIEVNEPVLDLRLQLEPERAFSHGATGFYQPQELALSHDTIPIDLAGGRVTVRRRYTTAGMTIIE